MDCRSDAPGSNPARVILDCFFPKLLKRLRLSWTFYQAEISREMPCESHWEGMSVWSMGMSAIRTKCPIHYYFFILPKLNLAHLPKFCITIVFNLSLGITVRRPQRNWRQCKILGDKPRCITGNEKMVNIICALDTNQESKIQVLKHHNDR